MSTSVTRTRNKNLTKNKHFKKTFLTFTFITALVVVFDRVYSIFSHNVSSAYMSFAFLYPLIGGVLLFGLIGLIKPTIVQQASYRFGFNLHNTGLASLVLASIIQGIFEIAGTASSYLIYMYEVGVLFLIIGLLSIIFAFFSKSK